MSVIGSNALAGASGQAGGSGYTVERSLRFNDDDTAYLNKTPSGQGSRTTFTFSCWAKRSTLAAYPVIFSAGSSSISLGYFQLSFEIGPMMAYIRHGGGTWAFTTNAVFRDTASWYSIILSVDSSANNASDRLKLYINGVQQTFTSSPTITQDFNFEVNSTIEHHIGAGKNSAGQTSVYYDGYLADVQFIDGSALSASDLGEFNSDGVWVPIKYAGTYGTRGYHLDFADGNDIGNDSSGNNNDWTVNNLTSQGGTVDRTAELSENHASGSVALPGRAFDATYISSKINTSTWAVTTTAWEGAYSSAYAEFRWIPAGGYAVSSSLRVYYGCYDNTAKTTTLTITYTDGSTETDSMTSGNNNWMKLFTASNAAGKTVQKIEMSPSTPSATNLQFGGFVVDGQIVPTLNTDSDVLRDSPTNGDATADTGAGGEVSGNYCTWNPLAGTNATLSNGNLDCSLSAGTTSKARATIAVTSGKYYWEITFKSGNYGMIGISDASLAGTQISYAAGALNYYVQTGGLYGDLGGSFSDTSYGSALSANDVLGVALDMDNGNVKFYKNGSDLGNANTTSLVGKTIMPHLGEAGGATFVTEANFGAKSFAYSAPSGYKPLCTANLPDSTIANGSTVFDTKLWTGTGGLDLASTSINTSTAYRHHRILFEGDNNGGSVSEIQFFDADGLIDASDTNNAGGSISSNKNQGLDAWTAFNGTLGGSSYSYGVRKDPSSGFYIAKDWGSGVTKTITAVKIWGVDSYAIAGNTASTYVKLQGSNDGSTWTDLQTWDDSRTGSWTTSSSTQVAHTSDTTTAISGYEFSPDLVWIKKRSGTSDHALFDTIRGATKRLYPNDTSHQDTSTDTLTAFNSDGFSLGNASDVNSQGDTYVGWAWDAGTSNTSISTGGLNSSVYDQSQRWRNYITSDIGWATNYGPAKAFNGVFDADGGAATDGANGVVTFTPPAMTVTSLEVNVYANSTITLPDGTTRSITGSGTVDNWSTVDIGSGFSFTGSNSIVFTPPTGVYTYIERIKINGKELVDDDVSVTNVPSIASTVRANPSAGFSIVSWTGTGSAGTLAHGLQKKPELIITKVYGDAPYSDNWPVYHSAYGAGTYTYFNSAIAAPASYLGFFNGVEPTSNVFTVGTANSDNTKYLIAYCFTSVEGYSAFGSYTGNGSSDGPCVFTGMRPAFILTKGIDDAEDWYIRDTARSPFNEVDESLRPNDSGSEYSGRTIDILSNGFKITDSDSQINESGKAYLYAAFAENPFQANGGLAR